MCADFFEGAEKLLEIWFDDSGGDLRSIGRESISEMLERANCKILSFLPGEQMDSYLLSESSLFVWRHKIVLKTCGVTTQIRAISRLLELAEGLCVDKVFYSRKKLMRPHLQDTVHQSFEREVEELKRIFGGGRSYTFGDMNEECWFLYFFSRTRQSSPGEEDTTLELLMVDFPPQFRAEVLQDVFPRAVVDQHHFSPCGYSANGVIDQFYCSVHVTPQPGFSFASFETNFPHNFDHVLSVVLGSFKPARFILTFFSRQSPAFHHTLWSREDLLDGGLYSRHDIHCAILENYRFTYAYYKLTL